MKHVTLIIGCLILVYNCLPVGANDLSCKSMTDQARNYIAKNMSEEAIRLLDAVNQNCPSNKEAIYLKGKALSKLGQYHDALTFYESALSKDPDYFDAQNGKCEVLSALHECNDVAECYDDLVQIQPSSETNNLAGNALTSTRCPLNYHGNFNSESEIYNRALEFYNKSLAINGNYTSAWNNKGVALGDLGRLNASIECFEKAIQINSSCSAAWNNIGVSLDKMQRHSEALESYEKAITLDPRLAEAWYNKAITLSDNLTMNEAVEESYRKAIEINPDLKKLEVPTLIYKRTS